MASSLPNTLREATQTNSTTFQMNNAKPYVLVNTLSINDIIKFLENIKQGCKITYSWKKYRYKITTKPQKH